MSNEALNTVLSSPKLPGLLTGLQGKARVAVELTRMRDLADRFERTFKGRVGEFFSSPGRTEITGNHTDHNGGVVLSASINLDMLAVAAPSNDDTVTLYSDRFPEPFIVSLTSLEKRKREAGTSSLIRGIAAGYKNRGYKIGGLNVVLSSNVLFASGLSSSAALEMLIASLFNDFFNEGKLDIKTRALIGQYAENEYWGKPSGLLDQMACGWGGLIYLDFSDSGTPNVQKVEYDFTKQRYKFLLVNTGGNHADLTKQYAQIPQEMWEVAKFFGAKRLCEVSRETFFAKLAEVREKLGDRAILRAIHFYDENNRVERQKRALAANDFNEFLNCINESGSSSWRLLQNTAVPEFPEHQEIQIGLALTERFFYNNGVRGACRVHGGGFAGAILVVLPDVNVEKFLAEIDPVFGKEAVTVLDIRQHGAINISRLVG